MSSVKGQLYKTKKIIYGWGVNDADYVTATRDADGKCVSCPYFKVWASMIGRCYSTAIQKKAERYHGCYVCDEWKYFTNFKVWMEQQDHVGKFLDKDLLVYGNKLYSQETCVFVSRRINQFLTLRDKQRGELPTGVSKKVSKINPKPFRFEISTNSLYTGPKRLRFETAIEAHQQWQKYKLEVGGKLLEMEEDDMVKVGLKRVLNLLESHLKSGAETKDL